MRSQREGRREQSRSGRRNSPDSPRRYMGSRDDYREGRNEYEDFGDYENDLDFQTSARSGGTQSYHNQRSRGSGRGQGINDYESMGRNENYGYRGQGFQSDDDMFNNEYESRSLGSYQDDDYDFDNRRSHRGMSSERDNDWYESDRYSQRPSRSRDWNQDDEFESDRYSSGSSQRSMQGRRGGQDFGSRSSRSDRRSSRY